MTTILLPLGEMPAAITDSIRTVLKAHDFTILAADGSVIDAARFEALLKECGRNAAQALYGIGLEPEEIPQLARVGAALEGAVR